MKNLKNAAIEKEKKYLLDRIEKFNQELSEAKENELTWTEKYMGIKTPYKKDRTEKVIKRLTSKNQKEIDRILNIINTVNAAPDKLDRPLMINIVFTKNRTWGYCPIAEDNNGNKVGSITGCGYDKESTASAKILNLNNTILKRMYKIKNDNIDIKNNILFGYGSGYDSLPSFESGVGIDCHYRILEKLGFNITKMSTSTTAILTISDL